jgi:hypothetical protein
MSHIYSGAEETITWLGEGHDEDVGDAFRFLNICDKNGSLDFIEMHNHWDLAYEVKNPRGPDDNPRVPEMIAKALRERDDF